MYHLEICIYFSTYFSKKMGKKNAKFLFIDYLLVIIRDQISYLLMLCVLLTRNSNILQQHESCLSLSELHFKSECHLLCESALQKNFDPMISDCVRNKIKSIVK